jgi:hypothetical protein
VDGCEDPRICLRISLQLATKVNMVTSYGSMSYAPTADHYSWGSSRPSTWSSSDYTAQFLVISPEFDVVL